MTVSERFKLCVNGGTNVRERRLNGAATGACSPRVAELGLELRSTSFSPRRPHRWPHRHRHGAWSAPRRSVVQACIHAAFRPKWSACGQLARAHTTKIRETQGRARGGTSSCRAGGPKEPEAGSDGTSMRAGPGPKAPPSPRLVCEAGCLSKGQGEPKAALVLATRSPPPVPRASDWREGVSY